MLSVVGVPDSDLETACRESASATGEPCSIANFLAPGIRVVSGGPMAVAAVEKRVAPSAVKVARLAVSGAFHTEMMAPASTALAEVLADVTILAPRIPVIANTTGKAYTSPEEIREELVKQVTMPVRWEDCVRSMLDDTQTEKGGLKLYELGPGRSLRAMIRKLDPAAFKATVNITV